MNSTYAGQCSCRHRVLVGNGLLRPAGVRLRVRTRCVLRRRTARPLRFGTVTIKVLWCRRLASNGSTAHEKAHAGGAAGRDGGPVRMNKTSPLGHGWSLSNSPGTLELCPYRPSAGARQDISPAHRWWRGASKSVLELPLSGSFPPKADYIPSPALGNRCPSCRSFLSELRGSVAAMAHKGCPMAVDGITGRSHSPQPSTSPALANGGIVPGFPARWS